MRFIMKRQARSAIVCVSEAGVYSLLSLTSKCSPKTWQCYRSPHDGREHEFPVFPQMSHCCHQWANWAASQMLRDVTSISLVSLSGCSCIPTAGVSLGARVTLSRRPVQTAARISSSPSFSSSLWRRWSPASLTTPCTWWCSGERMVTR